MKKRFFSIILTVTLVVGNMSGLKINAAEKECVEIEVTTVTPDAPAEEERAGYVDGIFYVPEGVARIEDGEYSGLSGFTAIDDENARIEKIVLPSTLEYIGNNAFERSTVEEIVIPGNVKEIGNDAFWDCNNLKKVTIEEGVEKIGRAVFRGCDNLETVILPKSIKEWNTECAFYNCNIKNITLPEEGLTTLGSGMFGGCPLEELVIPDCVTTMNYGVFVGCEELKTVEAGYNVVNFVQGEEYYDLLNFTLGAFGIGCSQMVLKAPLDSAIVEYARNYRYFTVKYDYPDFERMTYECSGILEKVDNYVIGSSDYNNVYAVDWDAKPVPETTTFEGGGPFKELYVGIWGGGGRVELISDVHPITIDMDVAWQAPDIRVFSWDYYTQDENLDYTVKHTDYFRVTVTEESLAEKRVQMEVLKSGTWDSEDAEWELITPAIDTSSLTPTPVPTVTVEPTATVEPAVTQRPNVQPTITDPTSEPTVIQKATPTPKIKTAKPGKTSLKSVKQMTKKQQGKKVYKRDVKLTWKKTKNADGYTIYMKTGSGKYKAVKTITKDETTSYIKKNLKKGKTYCFKVRAYKKVNGKKVYGNYSTVKKVKVK